MHRFFEYIMEAIGWLRIMASPLLIGLGLGAFIYLSNPTHTRLILAVMVASIGFIIGAIWATKIWKSKNGTMWFVSRTMATPELDDKEVNGATKEEK